MPSYQRLQQYAILISVASILYNGAEGAISIAFGSESSSRSLVFFGIQSGIEVASSIIVVWRFRSVAKPGEEAAAVISDRDLRVERVGTWGIGILLAMLAIGTEATAITGLVMHTEPDASNASLIISASALVIMVAIWLPKRYLARVLNSSTMQGEATCSLSCIQITCVLFIGSLVFRLWKGGWWVDNATSLVLGLLFARESWKMISWVRNPEFDGGCCSDCKRPRIDRDAELGDQYRDLCDCCLGKEECKEAGICKCNSGSDESLHCCKPKDAEGTKCCTHEVIKGARPSAQNRAGCQDSCCAAKDNIISKPVTEPSKIVREPRCENNCCGTRTTPAPTVMLSNNAQESDHPDDGLSCEDFCCDGGKLVEGASGGPTELPAAESESCPCCKA